MGCDCDCSKCVTVSALREAREQRDEARTEVAMVRESLQQWSDQAMRVLKERDAAREALRIAGETVKDLGDGLYAARAEVARLRDALALAERVVEAARYVNAYCDYDVRSGHEEDEHSDDCAKCEILKALAALDAAEVRA